MSDEMKKREKLQSSVEQDEELSKRTESAAQKDRALERD